jgi:hypothetical protein
VLIPRVFGIERAPIEFRMALMRAIAIAASLRTAVAIADENNRSAT